MSKARLSNTAAAVRRMLGSKKLPLLVVALLAAGSVANQSPPIDNGAGSAEVIREVNVTEQPDRINGQPVVAVDPDDPNIMVYISANHIPEADGLTVAEFQCYSAFSNDGGVTWTETEFPRGDRPFCGDPYLAVGPEGTFYAAFNRLGCPSDVEGGLSVPCDEGPGNVGVSRSYDGGQTWTEPVDTTVFRATTPRLRVDAETGKIYVSGGVGGPSPHAISVSDDGGLTWSDQAPLPSHPFGNQIAVHAGVLATATAMTVVGGTAVEATDVVFYSSTDDGVTFTAHPVTDSNGDPAQVPTGVSLPDNQTLNSTDPVPWVTADPAGTGRFAIMVPHGDAFAIYVTADSGESWVGPTVVPAEGARKPWIEYGADGQLGVTWRTLDDDKVDSYATVSFDGGATFSPALRVNAETQRWGYGTSGGDEWSRILFEGDGVFVTFADGRGGGSLDGIVARVPVSLFEVSGAPDTTRPEVTVSASAETPFDGHDVTFTVSAADDVALDRVVGNIYQNGALFKGTSSAAGGADALEHTVDIATVVPGGLPLGDYVLRYNAHDVAGNISVTKEFPFSVSDRTKPTATLVAPTTVGPFSTLTVQVDATDNLGLNRIVANIYKDGVLFKSTQTAANGTKAATHSATLTLPEGTYTIKYNASDLVGKISSTGTHTFTIDTTAPTVTVKTGASETIGADGEYQLVSFKLHDAGKIDRAVLNGVEKNLNDSVWSDVNFVKPGVFGAMQGENTLVAYDLAGNATTIVFVLS